MQRSASSGSVKTTRLKECAPCKMSPEKLAEYRASVNRRNKTWYAANRDAALRKDKERRIAQSAELRAKYIKASAELEDIYVKRLLRVSGIAPVQAIVEVKREILKIKRKLKGSI